MSELRPLAREAGGPGLRAAFVGPSGADEVDIWDAVLSVDLFREGGFGDDGAGAPPSCWLESAGELTATASSETVAGLLAMITDWCTLGQIILSTGRDLTSGTAKG